VTWSDDELFSDDVRSVVRRHDVTLPALLQPLLTFLCRRVLQLVVRSKFNRHATVSYRYCRTIILSTNRGTPLPVNQLSLVGFLSKIRILV